jgi:predicted small lipoprotein YifL
MSDDRLDRAVALLRDAGEAIRRLVLRGQVEPWADYPVLGDLDGRIRGFLAEGSVEPFIVPRPDAPPPVVPRLPAALHTVHLLVNGLAACGAGPPLSWPDAKRWTDSGDVSVVTCPGCRARRA